MGTQHGRSSFQSGSTGQPQSRRRKRSESGGSCDGHWAITRRGRDFLRSLSPTSEIRVLVRSRFLIYFKFASCLTPAYVILVSLRLRSSAT